MASTYPANALGVGQHLGHLRAGAAADFLHLSDDLAVRGTWIGGANVFAAS